MRIVRFFKKAERITKKIVFTAFFTAWSIGMFTGGPAGLVAAAAGIPFIIGIAVAGSR